MTSHTPPPPPLDYQSPPPPRHVFSASACISTAAVSGVLLVVLLFLVPRFEGIFLTFNTPLPAITVMVLQVSRWTAQGPWLTLVVLPIATGFLAAWFGAETPDRHDANSGEHRRSRRRRRSWAFRLMTIAIFAILIVTIVALFIPLVSLIQAAGGK